MLTIFLRTIQDRKISLAVYLIAGVALMWMYVAMFPAIQANGDNYEELIQAYPEGMLEAFGIQDISLDAFEHFLELEQFGLLWAIIVMFLLIAIAGSAISGEIEKGTIEIILSKAVSRMQIFFSKYLAGIFALVLFTIFSVFSVFPLTGIHNVNSSFMPYLYFFIISLFFGWTVFSMSMMFSALFSERGKVYMASGAVLITMYILNMVSALVDGASGFKYISFFYYFDHSKALVSGELNVLSVVVFLLAISIFTTIGALWFNKRDIAI